MRTLWHEDITLWSHYDHTKTIEIHIVKLLQYELHVYLVFIDELDVEFRAKHLAPGKDIQCCGCSYYFPWLHITKSDIRPQVKWAVSLMITNDHFTPYQGFVWVCVG